MSKLCFFSNNPCKAFKESTKYQKTEKPLIGINLTPDQVFFVAAAQVSQLEL